MQVAVDDHESYVIDQESAIGDLLREHGLEESNSTRTPIGSDCYKAPSVDSALLIATDGDGPRIRSFQSLVGTLLYCGWRAVRSQTLPSPSIRRRTRHISHASVIIKLPRALHDLKGTRVYKLRMTPKKSAGMTVT